MTSWQRKTIRKWWLEASPETRTKIVDDSVRFGWTPDELMLRLLAARTEERQPCAVCGDSLPPFSRFDRVTCSDRCRKSKSRL